MAQSDNPATLAAIGSLAYVCETLGHELFGHGGVCILSGGHITALAPLWMWCSVQTIPMVVAGPVFNLIVGGLFAAMLRLRARFDALGYFLWLSCGFNLLVACGYLIVGGATTFGDWGVAFGLVHPQWVWRAAMTAVGLAGYLISLRMLASLYQMRAGSSGFEGSTLRRRTLVPGVAAAVVACAAEIAGGHLAVGSVGLALGCTLFVGWSLSRIGDFRSLTVQAEAPAFSIAFRPTWIVAGILVSGFFVGVVGPVAFQGR